MVKCERCFTEFNGTVNCPRLLTAWGHTICEQCLNQLLEASNYSTSREEDLEERTFYCPEWGTEYEHMPVSNFPKNLYLLNLNKEKSEEGSGSVKRTSGSMQTTSPDKSNRSHEEVDTNCSSHGKKIEAYWMLCKQVLWIDCILNDGHKNHEINSIEKAVGIEKNLFYDFLKRSMEIEDRIKSQSRDIDNHFLMIRNQANKNKDAIAKIFNNVRKLINERENELKNQIFALLDEEESYLNDKKDSLNEQLITIESFKKQSRIIDSNNDIKVLQNSEFLYNLSQKALEKHCTVTFKDRFVDVKEDIELMHIWKLIDPAFTTAPNSKILKSSKYAPGGYKPNTGRTRSKDSRAEPLRSSNLLKKGSWNNTISNANKAFAGSPTKPYKPANLVKVNASDSEAPNYAKPIHNTKRKNKQNTIGKWFIFHDFRWARHYA
jgi:hypothetical protein